MKVFFHKNAIFKTYYNIDGGYLPFECDELNNKTFPDTTVYIRDIIEKIGSTSFTVTQIIVGKDKPEKIECELIDYIENGDDLILKICQDWG